LAPSFPLPTQPLSVRRTMGDTRTVGESVGCWKERDSYRAEMLVPGRVVEEMSEMVGAVLVLVLVVGANFLGDTLGCGLQRVLSSSMPAKHCFLFLMILFTLGIYGGDDTEPTAQAFHAFLLYVSFILVSSMEFRFVAAVVVVLVLLFQTNRYRRFYRKRPGFSSSDYRAAVTQEVLLAAIILLVSVGVPLYYAKQKRDHGDNFSIAKFVFGTAECEHKA
jgi:hypothetical protein